MGDKELKARFHLPGLRNNYPLNMFWLSLQETHPEYFRDGVEIASFFGCFPVALWNGGRLVTQDQCDAKYIRSVIKSINDKGIPVRYTFTNPTITEADLKDRYCNFCMEAADNGMNEVIVYSPVLEQYIRDKYPSFKINSTTCKEIRDVAELNAELDKDYSSVVLDYNFNNQWDILDGVGHHDKLEILVNAVCQPNCPRRGEHYRWMAEQQRRVLKNRIMPPYKQKPIEEWHCNAEFASIHTIQDYPTYVSPDQIWNDYLPKGIVNFKIEGRTIGIFSLLDTYLHYMIKPEKQGEVRLLMLRNLQEAHIVMVNRPKPAPWYPEK